MADKPASDRTEQATPERMRRAREEGQVAQSSEVPSAVVILLILVALGLTGGTLCKFLLAQCQQGLFFQFKGPLPSDTLPKMLCQSGARCLLQLTPILAAACVASVSGSLAISGWNVSFKTMGVKMENLSPAKGMGNLFSMKSLVQLPTALVKMAVIGLIVFMYLRDNMDAIVSTQWSSPAGIAAAIAGMGLGILWRLALGLSVIAVADLMYRRWQHRADLRMTRQEVKDESKRFEMPAAVKSRQRSMQLTMSKKRMLQKVKTADVVVTNPTHVAVALKYDPATMLAPVVVAKGADLLAAKIREIAALNDVPLVARPELARAMYANIELDQPVPESLFAAVAEVLAMIHRLRKRRQLGSLNNG